MPNATKAHRKGQRDRSRQRKRAYVGAHKMKFGCIDCKWLPEDGDHSELDLDHLPDYVKLANVSDLVSSDAGWRRIIAEMAKCEVVCRPCHMDRTERRHWAKIGRTPPTDLPVPF